MELCSDGEMAALLKAVEREEEDDLAAVDSALQRFPEDPRLHFMRGSILAGRQQPLPAHTALSRAVDLAPDFHLARYQLGFFELTSGEVDQALSTWGPLLRLTEDAYLRRFAEGLTHLVRDEFDRAVERLEAGIAANSENEPLNQDIRMLIAACENAATGQTNGSAHGESTQDKSATSILLGQFNRTAGDN